MIKKLILLVCFLFLTNYAFADTLASMTTHSQAESLGWDGANEQRWAQSFQLTTAATITEVDVDYNTTVDSPTGNVTMRIETSSVGGLPSGTLVHANATYSYVPVQESENALIFAASFDIAANTKYWMVWGCDVQEHSTYRRWRIGGSAVDTEYTSGTATNNADGAGWDLVGAGHDLYFVLKGTTLASRRVIILN